MLKKLNKLVVSLASLLTFSESSGAEIVLREGHYSFESEYQKPVPHPVGGCRFMEEVDHRAVKEVFFAHYRGNDFFPHPDMVFAEECGELVVLTPYSDEDMFGRTTRMIIPVRQFLFLVNEGEELYNYVFLTY